MISLFTTCKPFTGLDAIHQRNAVLSWKAHIPGEIIIVGNESGVAELCTELGLKHVPNVTYTNLGKPDVRDVFTKAAAVAQHGVMAYVNADVMLFEDFARAVTKVESAINQFMIIGQRTDIEWDDPVTDWNEVRQMVEWCGVLYHCQSTDYFVYRKGMLSNIVSGLGMGHLAWDNYLPWYAVKKDCAILVNGTAEILAVHQNHPMPNYDGHPGAAQNHAIVRNQNPAKPDDYCGLFLKDAKWTLGQDYIPGRLFCGYDVKLVPETDRWGGAWWQSQDRRIDGDGYPIAHDENLLYYVWGRIKDQTHPVIIDVGASTGMFALLAAHHPGMIGIAFEPTPEPRRILLQNIALNGLSERIQVRSEAVGNTNGAGQLYCTDYHLYSGLNRLNTQVDHHPNTAIPVSVIRLDDACEGMKPTFIKMDIEGGEYEAVLGAEHLIKAHAPSLLLECSTAMIPAYDHTTDELRGLLRAWGMVVEQADPGNIYAYYDQPFTSIVLPSMNRPERLEACVRRILETTTGGYELIVVIDVDTESWERVNAIGDPHIRTIFNSQRKGAIACWNQGLAAAHGRILAFYNDDCMPEPGWLPAALKAHKEQLGGYGLVGFNDGYQDGNVLAVQYLFDRQFCIDHLYGVMAYTPFRFAFNDTISNDLAKKTGRFYWCKESIVQHNHWSRDGGSMDELNQENMRMQGEDGFIYDKIKANNFVFDVEPVIRS